MFLRDLMLVGPDDVSVADDLLAADVQAIDSVRPREDEPGDEILGSAELEPVSAPDREVGSLSRRELADVVAAEHRRAASRAKSQRLAGSQCFRPAARTRDEQRLLDLEEEVAPLVGGRAVDAEADARAGVEKVADASDPGA